MNRNGMPALKVLRKVYPTLFHGIWMLWQKIGMHWFGVIMNLLCLSFGFENWESPVFISHTIVSS